MRSTSLRRIVALAYGAVCHGLFAVAVTAMALGLFTGLESGLGHARGSAALLVDGLLVVQFPVLHSLLLTRRGTRMLEHLAPAPLGRTMISTSYALIAAGQIALTFLAWCPTHVELWRPHAAPLVMLALGYALAWAFLLKALSDAGLGLQTGWIGWTAAFRGRPPAYPSMPVRGLFARCRQPIYLGFALVLWSGPVWTLDHVALALAWTAYCVLGPRHKERRFASHYGVDFSAYRARVPYLVPRLFS